MICNSDFFDEMNIYMFNLSSIRKMGQFQVNFKHCESEGMFRHIFLGILPTNFCVASASN